MRVFALLVALLAAAVSNAEEASKVVQLDIANWDDHIFQGTSNTTGKWFVLFYDEKCSYCQTELPLMEKLAREEEGQHNVTVAKVDITLPWNEPLRQTYVQHMGVPQQWLIKDGLRWRYRETSNVKQMTLWMNDFHDKYQNETMEIPPAGYVNMVKGAGNFWMTGNKKNALLVIFGAGALLGAVGFKLLFFVALRHMQAFNVLANGAQKPKED